MNTELYLRIELVLLFCPYNLAQRRGTPDWQPTYSQKSTDTTGVAEQNINNSEFEPKLLNVFLIQSEPKNINIKSIVLLFSIVFRWATQIAQHPRQSYEKESYCSMSFAASDPEI